MDGFACLEVHQLDALGIATRFPDLVDVDPHALTGGSHEHQLILIHDRKCANDLASLLGDFHRDDALGAAIRETVFVKRSAFPKALLRHHQHLSGRIRDSEGDHEVILAGLDAPYPGCRTANGPELFLIASDAHTMAGGEAELLLSIGENDLNEIVSILDVDGDDAVLPNIPIRGQRRLFDRSISGGEENELIFTPNRLVLLRGTFEPKHRRDFFVRPKVEQVLDAPPLPGS